MTPEEIRRLVGGYATGTLSEAQRKLVFEAALEDQELFDALAQDQALKELLDAPGVRQRLSASIEIREANPWWKHPLPWAMAGAAFSVSLGLFLLVFLTPSGSRPVSTAPKQIAQARPPVAAETPLSQSSRDGTGAVPKSAPKPQAPAAPPPSPELQNEPKQVEAKDQNAVAEQKVAPPPPAAAVPPPAPAAREAAPPPAPQGARDAVAGFLPSAPRSLSANIAPLPGRFAVDYSIHDGVLKIVPTGDGYLLVRAMVGPIDRLILPTSHLVSTRPAELRVPEGATELLVLFSARPIVEDTTEDWNTRGSPRKEMTGTVQDPRPSVSSRLELRLSLTQ